MNDSILEALNRAAEELTPQDIDTLITYYRKTRSQYEAGVKPKKEGEISKEELMAKLNLGGTASIPGFVKRI